MFYLIVALFIMVIVGLFAVQNATPVKVSFLWYYFEASLAVLIFLCVLAGALLSAMVSYSMKIKRSIRKRQLKPGGPETPVTRDHPSSPPGPQ